MEIREDFKVDFDGWKKEAKVLCRKAIVFILLFSVILPFGAYFLLEKFHLAAPSLTVIHYPLASATLWFFTMFSAFYILFYFKRVDFEDPKNVINIVRDIVYTFKNFIEYVKIHIIFFYVIAGLTVLTIFLGVFVTDPYEAKSNLYTLSSSLVGVYISFYLLVSTTTDYIFGVVYIGYGMVNREGAKILTNNAFNKYPELRNFIMKTSFIFSNAYIIGWLAIIFSSNYFIKLAIASLFIGSAVYYTAIYYLISRDLYGGKKQTQKVTEQVDDIDGVPMPL